MQISISSTGFTPADQGDEGAAEDHPEAVFGGPRGLQGEPADDPGGAGGGRPRPDDLVVEGRPGTQVGRTHQGRMQ